MTCSLSWDILSVAAACTGYTIPEAQALMVLGAKALLVPLVFLAAVLLTVYVVRR